MSMKRIKVIERYPIDRIKPNPWNPNRMEDWQIEKLKESIKRFGFVDPVLVRPSSDPDADYEIIDGEHRWRAAKEMKLKEIPVVIIEDVDNKEAQVLTVVSNELKGTADPAILFDIVVETQNDPLFDLLPFPDETLNWILSWQQPEPDFTMNEDTDSPKSWGKQTEAFLRFQLPLKYRGKVEKIRIELEKRSGVILGSNLNFLMEILILLVEKQLDRLQLEELKTLVEMVRQKSTK